VGRDGRGSPFTWVLSLIGVATLIGFRWRTGGDWISYEAWVFRSEFKTFGDVIQELDPGFALLALLSERTGLGMLFLNLSSGVVIVTCLGIFCRTQPRPWLALFISLPYFVIVVGMGYIRQALAISLLMMGLAALQNRGFWRYLFYVGAGVLFHSTVAVFASLAVLAKTRSRFWIAVWSVFSIGAAYFLVIRVQADAFLYGYIQSEYNSSGAWGRIAITALSGASFLLMHKSMSLNKVERSVWFYMSIISLTFPILLLVTPSSTAIDRVALYWLPLQILSFSRLPDALSGRFPRLLTTTSIVVSYLATFFVWSNFGDNAADWIPYRFIPL
jgi:hypothetical protein